MSNTARLISVLENAEKKDSWSNSALIETIKLSMESKARFHEKAVFIHGFWLGVVILIGMFMASKQGTLIYDLILGMR